MKMIFTAPDSQAAFKNLRSIGVNGRILLHRMPRCKHVFEASVEEGHCAV
jgi:hypothetical protein